MYRKNTKPSAVVVIESGKEDVKRLVRALKRRHWDEAWGEAFQDELRRLVDVWFSARQSVRRVFRAEESLNKGPVEVETLVIPVMGRIARIELGFLPGSDSDPKLRALSTFVHFLLNPENIRLGGPCPRCGVYYYKQIARFNQRYCSKKCSSKGTSAISHRRERIEARLQKIARTKHLIQTLRPSQIKNWKRAINNRDPEITPHWLTRAVHRGDLQEP